MCARYASMKENQEESTHKIGLGVMRTRNTLQPEQMLPDIHRSHSPLLPLQNVTFSKVPKATVITWSIKEVGAWLSTLSLSQDYVPVARENNITGEVLLNMSKEDWKEIGVKNFGDVRLLVLNVAKFQ